MRSPFFLNFRDCYMKINRLSSKQLVKYQLVLLVITTLVLSAASAFNSEVDYLWAINEMLFSFMLNIILMVSAIDSNIAISKYVFADRKKAILFSSCSSWGYTCMFTILVKCPYVIITDSWIPQPLIATGACTLVAVSITIAKKLKPNYLN